jgi:hypothetical protein
MRVGVNHTRLGVEEREGIEVEAGVGRWSRGQRIQ